MPLNSRLPLLVVSVMSPVSVAGVAMVMSSPNVVMSPFVDVVPAPSIRTSPPAVMFAVSAIVQRAADVESYVADGAGSRVHGAVQGDGLGRHDEIACRKCAAERQRRVDCDVVGARFAVDGYGRTESGVDGGDGDDVGAAAGVQRECTRRVGRRGNDL